MNPYLSIVVAARNDNYHGNFLGRFTHFLDCLSEMAERHGPPIELVIVEWNPPADRPPLEQAVAWPANRRQLAIRLIHVPPELHRTHSLSPTMPLLEFFAKSVGIRRAAGQFILCTNADVLFNDAVFQWLASRPLKSDSFYRISRRDVRPEIPEGLTIDQRLEFCAGHVFRRSHGNMVLPIKPSGAIQWSYFTFKRLLKHEWSRLHKGAAYRMHTQASGDFFLMSRDHWHQLRGYPDLPAYNGIDGYMCFLATAAGLKQRIIRDPMRMYHQEHDRAEHADRPPIDYSEYRKLRNQVIREKKPILHNDENWGWGSLNLREKMIG